MALRASAYNADDDQGNLDDVGLSYLQDDPEHAHRLPGHPRARLPEFSTHRDDLSPEPPYPPRVSSRHYTAPEPSESSPFAEQAFARTQGASMALPDPSQFPDPYPFRPHHNLNSMPALSSSGGSASNSTRSSAYASSSSNPVSGDYNNVQIASGDEYGGITPDSISQYLSKDPIAAPTARPTQSRAPVDHSRWSGAYSSSARSRSSSIGNNSPAAYDNSPIPNVPVLVQKPSYDISWQAVDERDEAGIVSEDETDDEHGILDADTGLADHEEERTSAAVIADEGRGLIVQANNTPIVQLQVQQGTTHLLIGSSTTPNAIPQFLKNALPLISTTLLALDISANFLGALPPVLSVCENLEELNVASNPLRVLPVFLADLHNLRLLIADSTGISTLPDTLVDLDKLHMLSIRRNKLHSLPSWLCLLPALQTLCVDWKSISSMVDNEADGTDVEDSSDVDPASPTHSNAAKHQLADEEDHTITPERAPMLARSITAPAPQVANSPPPEPPRPLQRTRTTPNRAYFDQARGPKGPPAESQLPSSLQRRDEPLPQGEREVRKMKSAGDLRRGKSATAIQDPSAGVPPLTNYSSASSSNLLNSMGNAPALPSSARQFGSLGPSSSLGGVSPRPPINAARPHLSKSLWDDPNSSSEHNSTSPEHLRKSYASSSTTVTQASTPNIQDRPGSSSQNVDGEDERREHIAYAIWAFAKAAFWLKDLPFRHSIQRNWPIPHTHGPMATSNSMPDRMSKTPQIDLRFSSIGILDMPALTVPASPPKISKKPSRDLLRGPSPHLYPHQGTPRDEASFPSRHLGSLSIPIPDSSAFLPNVTVSNGPTGIGEEGQDQKAPTPNQSPIADHEQYIRREEERAREAYMRALRSVMAYLKDMNDLAQSQQPNPISMYGGSGDDPVAPGMRSRRPTMVDRELSMLSNGSGSTDASSQLRSSESILALRSGASSQTLSVATTDSSSSMDERKYKDDKGKRTKIIQEIVVTERTYVKGLQELVEIYIKPAATPVNLLSGGVGSSKDSVVPAAERKVVFGGIDAVFSFHNDSFLPALEKAAAPLFKPNFQESDPDGKQSLDVAKAVGDIFVKHAAFMKMYSSYINNFDNSVQRVKSWTSATAGNASPGSAISPNSSTAQLVSLSLSVSGAGPPPLDAGLPTLTTSQKKRIKSYLKRCRLNPRHTQLNLEGYLLLPVQRIPRYKLLLDELVRSTPPTLYEFVEDPLDRALAEISLLTNNMNEGKRESESRRKLVQWQARIRGKFPSPLVQPHRRLIMDGRLLLTRVVRKAVVSFEAINAQGDASTVQVDCLAPELTPRPLVGILCNDLLVLCRDPTDGKDPHSAVDLWAVLRMQTLPQPASIVHGNALRLVDNKAILYFDAPTPSDALNWYRAINLHIPASASKV
ncbi:GrfA protein [Ephemerocybe angulata]|uniref:GrfA protein n=1 Tax=Ephemerocybe angulata TaxID=980116 RepID=A0A8H6MGX2_9AGAR|nr:GrfA protein [Tulosesus angulatus]